MNRFRANLNFHFSWLPYLVFFVISFIYFGFFENYLFFYQEKSSLFIFSLDFLRENLHQPGGLLIWLGKFFSTFYYYPLAGAIILSFILILIILLVSKVILFLTGEEGRVISFIIGVALFYLNTDYRFMLFNNLGLLFQLIIFSLTIRYLPYFKGWIPVLISPFWYFIMGGFSWLFVLLLTFYFAFYKVKNGWVKIATLWSLNILFVFLSKEFLFFQSGKTLLIFPFTRLDAGSQSIPFFSVAFILAILPIIFRIKFSIPSRFRISEFAGNLITTCLVFIILGVVGILRFDVKTSHYFQVGKLFYQNKYDEVIAYNRNHPSTNLLTIFLNNIALCEKGKLDDLLFDFPQSPDGKTLFLKWEMGVEILRRGGYFYYSIGMVNEAHRWAFENMVMKGLAPEDLKMLIKTELINGNYKVASKYITILKNTAFYNKEAKVFEKLLFNDADINADRELGEKRQNKIKTDFFSITDDPYINIERILVNDSLNKKAFEYKVALLLLRKDYKGIAYILPEFGKRGYTKLPMNVEEAALSLTLFNNGKFPYMGNLQINKNTELRWNQFLTIFQQHGANVIAAEPALKREFGNTFWYWSFYK